MNFLTVVSFTWQQGWRLSYANICWGPGNVSTTHVAVSMSTSRWPDGNCRYSEFCACCSCTSPASPTTEV